MKLTGIPETLLIALWARAAATQEKDPIIRDDKAVEMISQIEYDFTRFDKAKLTKLGVAIRTTILDQGVKDFLQKHPNALVVNFGAGLDTRRERIGCHDIDWYEIDVPESIELRKRFFEETEKYHFIAQSMLDLSWMDRIEPDGRPVLFLAEGLFMYFEEAQMKTLFTALAARMRDAEILFEMLAPFMVGKSKHHESVKKIESTTEFKWGMKNSREMETWAPGIQYVDETNYFDVHKHRWGTFGHLARAPFIRPYLASRIVHLRFGAN